MRVNNRAAMALAGACLLVGGAFGCGPEMSGWRPLPAQRHVMAWARPEEGCDWVEAKGLFEIEGTAPCTVSAIVDPTDGEEDNYWPRSKYISKTDVSFGDSTTWDDATASSKATWGIFPNSEPWSLAVRHTYTASGSYIVRGRATYWDGELIYSEPGFVLVRVLAPE